MLGLLVRPICLCYLISIIQCQQLFSFIPLFFQTQCSYDFQLLDESIRSLYLIIKSHLSIDVTSSFECSSLFESNSLP